MDKRRFPRVLERCGDIAALSVEEGGDVSVTRVYNDFLAVPGSAYLDADKALKDAEAKEKKERKEGLAALEAITDPYAKVRKLAFMYVKDRSLPAALSDLPTDTDKMEGIRLLLEIVDENKAADWAKELVEDTSPNSFVNLAPIAIREIDEWSRASVSVQKARNKRAELYGVAYEAYLSFKDMVRTVFGPSSIHYRRIHVKSNGKIALDDVDGDDDGTET